MEPWTRNRPQRHRLTCSSKSQLRRCVSGLAIGSNRFKAKLYQHPRSSLPAATHAGVSMHSGWLVETHSLTRRPRGVAETSTSSQSSYQLSRPHRCPCYLGWRHRQPGHVRQRLRASDLTAGGASEADDEPPVVSQVFPRIRESNPYRRLGISEEATFEEVQEARNFLYEAYKHHEPSREAIEWAFDRILKTAFKRREKFGFQPPKTGRKTDLRGDVLGPSLIARFKDSIEPSVPFATLVNDGSIFLVLGIWAAWQATATDPTFPIALALIYSAYKFFTKRKNRFPDGPHFGGSPIWGALGMTVAGLALGVLASTALLKFVPLPRALQAEGFGLLILCAIVGLFTLFFR